MAKNILNLMKNIVVQRPNWNGSSCVQAIKLYETPKQGSGTQNALRHGPCPLLLDTTPNHDRDHSVLSFNEFLLYLRMSPGTV